MALPYLDLYKLAQNTNFQQRVQFALWRSANTVVNEAPATPNHAARLVWAKEQLRGPSQNMTAILNQVLTTGIVFNNGDASTDGQLQAVIDGLVDSLAVP